MNQVCLLILTHLKRKQYERFNSKLKQNKQYVGTYSSD